MPTILVATRDGLHTYDNEAQPREADHVGRSVTALGRARDEFWAIVEGSELWHAARGDWSHVTDLDDLSATCVAAIGADVFVGSSVARLFRLVGEALEPVIAVDHPEGRDTGYTP